MTSDHEQAFDWHVASRLPVYFLPIQLVAFMLGYTSLLMVALFNGGIGPISGLGLFLLANLLLGIVAGATSPSIARGVLIGLLSVIAAIILTLLLLILPVISGVIDNSLVNVVTDKLTLQAALSLLTFPFSFLTMILGSAIHERSGLP